MNIDQWISCISEAYTIILKRGLSSFEKEILLRELPIPNFTETEIEKCVLFQSGVVPFEIDFQDEDTNEFIAETIETIKQYFFKKVVVGETFGKIERVIRELPISGGSLEKHYGVSGGPFINLAKTYWTYKVEMQDLFPSYYKLILSQLLLELEIEIGSSFFPAPPISEQAVIWARQRREMQREMLEKYAPGFDIETFLENNPFLGTGAGRIAKSVFNEKIWIRCYNHDFPQFLKIPNTVKPLIIKCPKCKCSFRFPAKDFRWTNLLPPHLHPSPQKIDELENLRRFWNIPEDIFFLRIISSPWSTRQNQEYKLELFRSQMPQTSEKELWKKVLESRTEIQQTVDGLLYKNLNAEEIDKMVYKARSFEELCNQLIEFEKKNVIEPPSPDPFGIGAKIDEILLR